MLLCKESMAVTLLALGYASSYAPHSFTFRPPAIATSARRFRHQRRHPRSIDTNFVVRSSVPSDDQSEVVKVSLANAKAGDGGALQALFSKRCDSDGLMTKETLSSLPAIMDLLSTGDLLVAELDEIWKTAPKFPDVEASVERIDVDSFIKIYRDIDDIFEDDDGGDMEETMLKNGVLQGTKAVDDAVEDCDDPEEAKDEQELELTFKTICDDAALISKAALKEWSEIKDLIGDGMLGDDEFDKIWECTAKSPGSSDQLDVEGFLSFNVELDDLFVFDDNDEVADNVGATIAPIGQEKNGVEAPNKMFYGEDLPPNVIFSELANDSSLIGMAELKRWGDLQSMLGDGEILPSEFQDIYDKVPKASEGINAINEDGFVQLYEAIEALFEDEEDEARRSASLKADLLDYVYNMNSNKDLMPCGLESLDSEMQEVLDLVKTLESEPSNIVVSNGGDILSEDVVGDWELLYTTSATMKFNKGLSGLVPPGGKFGGLRQKLTATKYLADVEYVEQIDAGPSSFEVRVTGDWELKNSASLFTGTRSIALSVEPDKVIYGLTTTKGDHWKSLGPMNLLSFSYLDDDIRIMRGTTSMDNIFIFKKVR